MATKLLTVMLSSRCNDSIEYQGKHKTLSDVRRDAKERIESIKIGGLRLFQCWINEDAPATDGSLDSWDTCMQQAKDADIVICLFNGNAGWPGKQGTICICHAELTEAFNANPGKVCAIKLPGDANHANSRDEVQRTRDQRMEEDIGRLNVFRSSPANGEKLLAEIEKTIGELLRNLAKSATPRSSASTYHLGQALDWNRMSYEGRQRAIIRVLRSALGDDSDDVAAPVLKELHNKTVLFRCHGLPGPASESTAREAVGRPFLADYIFYDQLTGKRIGPVHVIGCHKTISESQARNILGFPDATIIDTDFGVYVADPVQHIQMVLLRGCRDESTTHHRVQRMLAWLDRSQEMSHFLRRAASRAKICKAIAKERPN